MYYFGEFDYLTSMIRRTIQDKISTKIGRGKAIMVIGPRQVGKTTLISQFLKDKDFKFFDRDDPQFDKY